MTTTDKLQEFTAAAMALAVILTVCALAILQSLGYAKGSPPEYLLVIATGIASYFFGQRSGTTKLNGNVSKLADAAATIAAAQAQTPAGPPPAAGSGGS